MKIVSIACLLALTSVDAFWSSKQQQVAPEASLCVDKGGDCTNNPSSCCDAFVCSGTVKHKTCAEPPVCLKQGYDCSEGSAPCCNGGTCILNEETDSFECQTGILSGVQRHRDGTVTDTRRGRRLDGDSPNMNTTVVPGESVTTSIGCSTGDPHIRTFDGLKYDCHGEGEFVLVKSNYTAREIQMRYEHMSVERALSVGKSVAIRDEGDAPIVQISIASLNTTAGYDMGDNDNCGRVQLFVDGVQRDLSSGSGQDDKVTVTHAHKDVIVKYHQSGMRIKVRYHRCRLNVCVTLPDTDPTIVGVLGTPTSVVEDDWTIPDGTQLEVPEALVDRLRKPAYDFCTQNYCLRDEQRSLFTTYEDGFDFDYYQKCDLPFDSTIEEYVGEETPQWIKDICKGDLQCVMDMHNGDVTDQEAVREILEEYAEKCNPRGGECDESACCDSQCVDNGGLAGKVCSSDSAMCSPEYGSCQDSECCDSLTCTTVDNGDSLCLMEHQCMDEWMSCGDVACCEGMVCLENRFGNKQCRRLHQCSEKYDDCSMVGCCGTMKCLLEDGFKQCDDVPDCWDQENKDCTHVPCCDGLTCVNDSENGQNLCKSVPEIASRFESCEYTQCDEEADIPLECVAVSDEEENEDMQCRYTAGSAQVLVFNDVNSNGIKDDNEPGLSGIPLSLIFDRSGEVVNGTVTETTDENGYVEFNDIPRGVPLRVKCLGAPKGALRTIHNKGTDDSIDSDLGDDDLTSPFVVTGGVWTNTALGYRMPADLEIHVFNDVNNNGIFDTNEVGIPDVAIRLIKSADGENIFHQQNDGTAHEELTTDANGRVLFTKVPQSLGIRAKITRAPAGSSPTIGNIGSDDNVDSDLRSDGTSYGFKIKVGGVHNSVDLGLVMPESVTVRVWDDANSNGIFDNGELPISNVMLRLVDDSTRENIPDSGNGGNAHTELTTDNEGIVTFTKVPRDRKIRVKVTGGAPSGALHTQSYLRSGGSQSLSDLESGDISRSFSVSNTGSQIDLGYNLPGSMTVRVWEDVSGYGLMDGNEKGIEGVQLRLVLDGTLENVSEFMAGEGNADSELSTNAEGYVTFTQVPRGLSLRVKVTNAPGGDLKHTLQNVGNDPELDSDLGPDGLSNSFKLSKNAMTEVNLGYRLPHTVVVRVWDDENKNGIQDEGEAGIPGATLRIVYDADSSFYEGECEATDDSSPTENKSEGLCNEELVSDDDGVCTFRGVPRGKFRVKVLNKPHNVRRTSQNRGDSEANDSDFGDDGVSHTFDLSSFGGPVFDQVGLGYILPKDVVIRVWDDSNGNGIQDPQEIGVSGVGLRLVKASNGEVDENFEEILTNVNGTATFVGVPTNEHFRVKVTNAPAGAVRTSLNTQDDAVDSDLRSDGTTVSFYLGSFDGDVFDKVDIGYLLPKDIEVKVWNDVNGNGYQDEEEEGVPGVSCRLINNRKALSNTGGGSTAHLELMTNATGYVTFKKAPKSKDLRVELLNAGGAVPTKQNAGTNGEEIDSDLGLDLTSDEFNLHSFTGGVYGSIDLGLQMPKKVIVRVWNDTNLDGIQDDGEEGIPGVSLQLIMDSNRSFLDDHGGEGNSHQAAVSDEFGRCEFTGVPMGQRYRVKVLEGPPNGIITKRNAGNDEKVDSDMNPSGITDSFKLPVGVEELYDALDVGYYFPESSNAYVERVVTFETPESAIEVEGATLPLNITLDIPSDLEDYVGPVNKYFEIDSRAYPNLVFLADGEIQGDLQSNGWTRFDPSIVSQLSVQADHDFSGEFDLPVRNVVKGLFRSRPVDVVQERNFPVKFLPVADRLELPSLLIATEDDDNIALGEHIANLGDSISDRGERSDNNENKETLLEVELIVPADTDDMSYAFSGTYVPPYTTAMSGSGSATVTHTIDDEGVRVYKVTSSLMGSPEQTNQQTREQAEADILETIRSFNLKLDTEHTDLDGDITVKISNVDVNVGVADIRETSFNPLLVQAVADMPGVEVTRTTRVGVEDDGEEIPLHIVALPSADQDGSETISVKITVPSDAVGPVGNITGANTPAGVEITGGEDGSYLVTSSSGLEDLNSFLDASVTFMPRENYAGILNGADGIRVDVISTESATGNQVKTKTATASDYIDIEVSPVLDGTTVKVKGNAVGKEDNIIPIPLSITVGDPDGSETYRMLIESTNLPTGTRLFGATGELFPSTESAQYVLSEDDIANLSLLPPEHYSSALPSQGDITLFTTTETQETGLEEVVSLDLQIPIRVIGVADKPEKRKISIESLEDEPYDIGAAITAAGPIGDILVDRDGSEKLTLTLMGLPNGVVPQSDVSDGISFLGNGRYQIAQSAIETLVLPPIPEYSGDEPYPDIVMRATSQEMDGSQSNSKWWKLDFAIEPVVDGFGTAWTSKVNVVEGDNEASKADISFASITDQRLIDSDNSETVLEYILHFSTFLQDAGISEHIVKNLSVSTLKEVVESYLVGDFVFDEALGTVTVLPDDIAGIALKPELFLDSNQDFSIPVEVLVEDKAIIHGQEVTRRGLDPGTFKVNIRGTADVPTVFANSTAGNSGSLIPLSVGGETTDTDADLGRDESETVYYILEYLNPGPNRTRWALLNGGGSVVGFNQGDYKWLLEADDIDDLRLLTYYFGNETETMEFKFTSIALENDGDIATNETTFNVVVSPGTGEGESPVPIGPLVEIGDHNGTEDTAVPLDVDAKADPHDPSNPKVTVVVSGIPSGAQVTGALLNPVTGKLVAKAEDIAAGLIQITPPKDFSGPMPINVEAVATNQWALTATTGEIPINFEIDPVADGAKITFEATPLREDEEVNLGITLTEIDVDGSEEVGEFSYVQISNIAALQGGYSLVQGNDSDSVVLGKNVVGYYRVPSNDLASLVLEPLEHWHGGIAISLVTTVVEPLDNEDGDHIHLSQGSKTFTVVPVADPPIVNVPAEPVVGQEDEWIVIGDELLVELVDNVETNGAEQLSVVLSGIPKDTILSSGSNNGDGSWVIDASDLKTLSLFPPENFGGEMNLTLTGLAVELSNGYSEASTAKDFTVVVEAVADSFLIVAENPTLTGTGVDLELNIRMLGLSNHNTTLDELPPERLSLQFAGIPAGLRLWTTQGGTIQEVSSGIYNFTGTPAQANALQIVRSGPAFAEPTTAETSQHVVTITGVTSDSGHILDTPVYDEFVLYATPNPVFVEGIEATDSNLSGTEGNDILTGTAADDILNGAGGNDIIRGGPGIDTMTGGAGSDIFEWKQEDLLGSLDVITDFESGPGGDILDLSGLVTIIDWDAAAPADPIPAPEGLIAKYAKLEQNGDSTLVSVDLTGSETDFVPVVELVGVTGLDLATLVAEGNIMI